MEEMEVDAGMLGKGLMECGGFGQFVFSDARI